MYAGGRCKILHAKVNNHGFPVSFQSGKRDRVYQGDKPLADIMYQTTNLDIVSGYTDTLKQFDLQKEELLAVDVFRDAKAYSKKSRLLLYSALFERNIDSSVLRPYPGGLAFISPFSRSANHDLCDC